MPRLPTQFQDEAGTLMADAVYAVGKLETTLDRLANYDAVTSLANRDQFLRLLDPLVARKAAFAVGVIGIANHHRIISSFGQETADFVLREAARRLATGVGTSHLVGRVDARVLAVALTQSSDPVEISSEFERIMHILGIEVVHGDDRILLELAAGVTLYPGDGAGPQVLLDNALTALGDRIDHVGTAVGFYSTAACEAALQRFSLEQELRQALADNQFVLHFQPAIDYDARRLTGAEALIRWHHPERGLLLPGKFIPVAEASSLVDEIGLWVLQAACLEARHWQTLALGDLKVAVNLSARQFRDPHLVKRIEDTAAAAGIPASRLELELTETATMLDAQHTRQVFGELREMGISVAIDDFGTGYSSMRNLQSLPFDKLKIDRAFVTRIETRRSSQAICKALIALSQGLGIDVMAEGTETRDEVRELHRLGCFQFQGYYFSRPLAAREFEAQITDTAWVDRSTRSGSA